MEPVLIRGLPRLNAEDRRCPEHFRRVRHSRRPDRHRASFKRIHDTEETRDRRSENES